MIDIFKLEPVKIPDFHPVNAGTWIIKHKDGRTRHLRLLKISHEPEGPRLHFVDYFTGESLSMPQNKFDALIKNRK